MCVPYPALRLPSPREKATLAQKTRSKKPMKGTMKNNDTREVTDPKASNIMPPVDTKVDKDLDQVTNDDVDSEDLQPSCYVRVVAIDRKEGLTDEAWQEAADQVLSEQPLLHGKLSC